MAEIGKKSILKGGSHTFKSDDFIPQYLKFQIDSNGDAENEIINLYGITISVSVAAGKTLISNETLGDLIRFAKGSVGVVTIGGRVTFSLPICDGWIQGTGLNVVVNNEDAVPQSEGDADDSDNGCHVYIYEESYVEGTGLLYSYESDFFSKTKHKTLLSKNEDTPWLQALVGKGFTKVEGNYGTGANYTMSYNECKISEFQEDDTAMLFLPNSADPFDSASAIAAYSDQADFKTAFGAGAHKLFSVAAFENILFDNQPVMSDNGLVYPFRDMKAELPEGGTLKVLYKRPMFK